MFHLHKWTEWSDPYVVNMYWVNFATNAKTKYVERRQKRTCTKCNKQQEEEVR